MSDPNAFDRGLGKPLRPGIRALIQLSTPSRYAIAVAAAVAALLVRFSLQPLLGSRLPFLLFYPAVIVSGWAGGFWPGVVTTLLSAAAASAFWIPSLSSWAAEPADALGVVIFTIVGIVGSALNEAWRRGAAEILRVEADYTAHEHAARVEAEGAARQLRLAVNASPAAMIIIDRSGAIVFANAPTARLLGYNERELKGMLVEDLVPERFRSGHAVLRAGFFQAVSRRPMGAGRDLYALRKDGSEVPVEIGLNPYETEEGAQVIAAITDITERKKTEQQKTELLRLEQEAAQRKDEFLATLSHELRNPLAPIRTAVHLLGRVDGTSEEARAARAIIERQLGHLVRLVDDLLDIARISQDRLQLHRDRVDLAEVLQSAVESSRPLIESRGHVLDVKLPSAPLWVDADVVRLAQVFANLLNNAAKFTPEGGHVTLEAHRDAGAVVVRVKDDGEGFDGEARRQLFEMFGQGPVRGRAKGGLGIGLALARRFAELHGGTLEGTSDGAGRGSTFTVRLPAAEAPPASLAAPELAPEPATRHRILVAEDNEDMASALAMLLEDHEVRVAKDGLEACALAESFRPEIALLDIGMPGLDGYQAARRIREQPGGDAILLVALTGWGQAEDRRRSEEAGFAIHLTKPVDPRALTQLLSLPWPPPREEN
jgi:PAS domain S-box-containing protein